jgi:aryl-alcohol dehydrogenase-like predicted oxidoreductase
MQLRRFGRTGLQVTALGFGGAEIGYEAATDATVDRLLNAALDAGLNVVDTAECYLASEELIGRAIAGRRDEYHLFTKVGHAAGLPHPEWSPDLITASIERSLARLRTDRLELIQLHSCGLDALRAGAATAALQRARDAGKCRFIGYSGDGEAARFAAESGDFDVIQTSLSVADQRNIDVVLPAARARDLGVIAKRPIANAAWRHGRRPDNPYHHTYWDRLQALRYDFLGEPATAVEIALRFTLGLPGVSTAIVGTANPERWAANAALAAKGPLPAAQIEAIRARWAAVAGADWDGQT